MKNKQNGKINIIFVQIQKHANKTKVQQKTTKNQNIFSTIMKNKQNEKINKTKQNF